LIESGKPLTERTFPGELELQFGKGWKVVAKGESVKHMLSHQIIRAVFWEVVPPKGFTAPRDWRQLAEKDAAELAVPRLIERWLEKRLSERVYLRSPIPEQ
jgi:hypothetical protein